MSVQFRTTAPNPVGGEWPKLTPAQDEKLVDFVHDSMKFLFDRTIVPQFHAQHEGDTRKTAESIATLFVGFLHNYLAANVEGEPKGAYKEISEATKSFLDFCHARMNIMSAGLAAGLSPEIVQAMIAGSLAMGGAKMRVFKIKPGEELPEELKRLLSDD